MVKKEQKRARQPRFVFMAKSEIDHLEDGYRWRKLVCAKGSQEQPIPKHPYKSRQRQKRSRFISIHINPGNARNARN
uniref:WRKY domain-containing protein n=1 Tax=Oryza brachyantha TaxID=4533 RepID=J3LHY2_ORYBR